MNMSSTGAVRSPAPPQAQPPPPVDRDGDHDNSTSAADAAEAARGAAMRDAGVGRNVNAAA